MLPDLSKLAVTGVSNAGEFEKEGRIGKVATHVAGNEARGSMPCWIALTAPDASAETALKKASFALPSQVFYGQYVPEEPEAGDDVDMGGGQGDQVEQVDGEVETHEFKLSSNSSHAVILGHKINFDETPTIELVGDMDTANPDEFKVEFQVWKKVILAQSEMGQKIAECRLGMRNIFSDANGKKLPYWDPDVYVATPFTNGNSWTAAREKLERLDKLKKVLTEEKAEGQVGGFPFATAEGMRLHNWLPCLQSDVILYYVECLSDRAYPPMVGAWMLPEDPAMKQSRDNLFADAFPAINSDSGHPESAGPCVHNCEEKLRDENDVLRKGYVEGLASCPIKNFMFKRAMEHEKNKPGSAVFARAQREFEGMQGGGDGGDGKSGKKRKKT